MNRKFNYIFFFVATVSAVVIRAIMLFFTIDPQSGFFKKEYGAASILMMAIIAAAMCLLYFFARVSKDPIPPRKPGGLFVAAGGLFLAVVILYDTFFYPMEYAAPGWQTSAQTVFAVGAALTLIFVSAAAVFPFSFPPIITLIPLLFWFMRLIIVFTAYTTLATVSDNLFELASLGLILIFFLQYAKIYTSELTEKGGKRTFAIGLSAAGVCLTNSVARILVQLTGHADRLHSTDMPPITCLAAGIFILIFCLNCYPIFAKKSSDEE